MDNDRGQSLITKYVWVIETIYRKRKILCLDDEGNLSRTLLSIEKEAVDYNKTIIVFVSFYLY